MMTDEARRIGLSKSTFANATGLEAPNHLMTARELAMLARYLSTNIRNSIPSSAKKNFSTANTGSSIAIRCFR